MADARLVKQLPHREAVEASWCRARWGTAQDATPSKYSAPRMSKPCQVDGDPPVTWGQSAGSSLCTVTCDVRRLVLTLKQCQRRLIPQYNL